METKRQRDEGRNTFDHRVTFLVPSCISTVCSSGSWSAAGTESKPPLQRPDDEAAPSGDGAKQVHHATLQPHDGRRAHGDLCVTCQVPEVTIQVFAKLMGIVDEQNCGRWWEATISLFFESGGPTFFVNAEGRHHDERCRFPESENHSSCQILWASGKIAGDGGKPSSPPPGGRGRALLAKPREVFGRSGKPAARRRQRRDKTLSMWALYGTQVQLKKQQRGRSGLGREQNWSP